MTNAAPEAITWRLETDDAFWDRLRRHFTEHLDALSPESLATLERNPLRVLDSKRDQDADVVAAARRADDAAQDSAAASPVLSCHKAG